jgi:hypothetical protein
MSLSNSAVLVELNISSWSGRKLDRKVSDEVTQGKSASKDAARVNKNLFAGSDKLEKINNFVSGLRKEYYSMTLPWSTTGTRMLPIKQFFDFKQWVSEQEAEFGRLVTVFLDEYHSQISIQAFRLGTMFNADEYPNVAELQNKFRFAFVMMPLPECGDFRVDAEAELRAELEKQYESVYNDRTESAMKDLWDRLYTTVSHLRDKCAMEKTIFRESTLDNAIELCGILTRLNITNDPTLEQRRQELERALCTVDIEGLRKDEGVRQDTKSKMDELLAKMGGLGL